MVKKLLITVTSGLIVLLVLVGALLLVFSTRGYFSDIITLLLVGLIGILILFAIYMVVTYTIEIVRHRGADVETLSEKNIHSLLKTGEIPAVKENESVKKSKFSFLFSLSAPLKPKTVEEKPAATQIPMPVKAAPTTASDGTTEIPKIEAIQEPVTVPGATVAPASKEDHQKAVEAVRVQAEAAAVARRKAAAMAARSQAFPAIRTDQIPAFNTGLLSGNAPQERIDTRAHILKPPTERPAELQRSGSIWEQMNVRQSAAPILEHPDAPPSSTDVTPRQTLGLNRTGSHNITPADVEAAKQPWQPPKQPKAWSGGEKIPGDMSVFAKPNTVNTASDAYARAEEARANTKIAEAKIAEAKIAATKADPGKRTSDKASLESVNVLVEEIKRTRGRPPKPVSEETPEAPKRPRGRPPKPKTEEELNAPKRPRGRPPKPKTEEELNAPKRPRGRPRKNLESTTDSTPEAETK